MKIAVSGCLNGHKCRFDGGSKKDDFIINNLSKYSDFITFCPEDSLFGSPRESLRIVRKGNQNRVIGNKTKNDFTELLKEESQKVVERLKKENLSGIIFKSKSPTCGISRLKIYAEDGNLYFNDGVGVLAELVKEQMSEIPFEDEGRLQDDWLKENFMMRIFAFENFNNFKNKDNLQIKDLIKFHSNYKYLLLSKNEKIYREMGRIVANHEKLEFDEVLKHYEKKFKKVISTNGNKNTVFNVLLHMHGFLKEFLSKDEKQELLTLFEDFKNGIIPLITPISIIKIYAEKFNVKFLKNQIFLEPYPKELALRSSIKAFK